MKTPYNMTENEFLDWIDSLFPKFGKSDIRKEKHGKGGV